MKREQALKAHAERTRAEIDWASNPHDYEVEPATFLVRGDLLKRFCIVGKDGAPIMPLKFYVTKDAASDAIGEMICDDEADRRLNRHRHEQRRD